MKIVKVTRVITYTGPEREVLSLAKASLIIPDALQGIRVTDSIVGIPQLVRVEGDKDKTKSPEGAEGG